MIMALRFWRILEADLGAIFVRDMCYFFSNSGTENDQCRMILMRFRSNIRFENDAPTAI